MRLWDVATGKQEQLFAGHEAAVRWTGTAGLLARRILGLGPVAPPVG